MRRIMLIFAVLFIAVISTACINNFAVQELNNKAKVFLENGDYENAINRLEASLDLDNTIFETHYNLGIAYIKAKKFEKALAVLTKAVEMQDNSADVFYSLAVAQESYAQELLSDNNVATTSEEVLKDTDETQVIMSPEERKVKAIELYSKAVDSYKKYLSLSPNAKDSAEIQSQIEEDTKELKRISE